MWIAELNLDPTTEFDRYHVDTLEKICIKNHPFKGDFIT